MAGFQTKTFQKHDDYMTPKTAWEAILQFIPKDKVIWEPFYGDGRSGQILRELGLTVIHQDEDFFENNRGDVVVSNPPFTMIPQVLERLVQLGKPFIVIMPAPKLFTQYVRKLFATLDDPIQIIIPRKRIQFIKLVDGEVPEDYDSKCNFDCFYYCWKMNIPRDIFWLEK
jgi:hypothetical protein